MIDLSNIEMKEEKRQSSKGNQMKWLKDGLWYKADYTGYEGLAEYVVSTLIKTSNLAGDAYQLYETEQIQYQFAKYLGCKSKNFLPEGWQMITLERLFMNTYGQSLNSSIYTIRNLEERVKFLIDQVKRITGLEEFGKYICNLMTIDALFLNEDRHTHNIAVLMDSEGHYRYCPIFDNGGCLLSDTTIDYPIGVGVEKLMRTVTAKTFCQSFDEQLDVAEALYGHSLKFDFRVEDIEQILEDELYYPMEVKMRVLEILKEQRRKYQYLFK